MDFDDIVKIVDQVKVLEARLAAVEAERDAARAGEARAVEALKRIVRCEILPDAQDLNHGDHCLCNFCENKDIHEQILAAMNSNALDWLAQQRREAAAEAMGSFADYLEQHTRPPRPGIVRLARIKAKETRAAALRAGATGGADASL